MHSTTYNQLNIFHAIVQEGSINGAARRLDLATPSVSQALKTLEKNIGQKLFFRSTRSIALTESGQQLFERTFVLSKELNHALESVRESSHSPSGKISINVPRFVMQYYLKPVYSEFCRLCPDIQLDIIVNDGDVNLSNQDIDFGICFGDKVEQGLITKALTAPLFEALFAAPEYIAEYGLPTAITQLKYHKLIQYRLNDSLQLAPLILTDRGQSISVEMPCALIVNDCDLMLDAAQQGLGIGRIVEPAIIEHLALGELLPVLQQHWQCYPGLYLYYEQSTQRLERNRLFIDFLRHQFALRTA